MEVVVSFMYRKKYLTAPYFILMTIFIVTIPFAEVTANESKHYQDILALKAKVTALEKKHQSVNAPNDSTLNNIKLTGLVEVEAVYSDSANNNGSDVTVSTVTLGFDARVTPWVNTHVLILFEEDETDPAEIDEVTITLGNPDTTPFSLVVGRIYLPFGQFETSMISDPLTLEMGETRETALQLDYQLEKYYGAIFFFNGETKNTDVQAIDGFGFNLGMTREAQSNAISYNIGLSWLNNIADSDALQESVSDADNLSDKVAGLSLYATTQYRSFTIIAEYLGAANTFNVTDLNFNGTGAKPVAFNVELDYAFKLIAKEMTLALSWQKTKQALTLGLAEKRFLIGLSLTIFNDTLLSFEYTHEEDYSINHGGSDEDTDNVTIQLVVEF